MSFRVGFGFDVHVLENGQPFWLGGINIPHKKGAKGHSDADVMIHAICDALLGAAALGDIGYHFPDNSNQYKGIDSKILLAEVIVLLEREGYKIGNVDVTLCLQEPKIAPYIQEMRQTLSSVMKVHESQLSIKATTTEKLGFVGREEGISSYAVALIEKIISE
jgi:2-C-methyl-D-erythritol 2,4-cyclodiphosphate synthase